MGDNQKEAPAPASNFDLSGDGAPMYDSDTQLRTAIIRRLLHEYRTTNYYLANAMQSTFLRFIIRDSYPSTISPPEYNRPKSDSNYYEPRNDDHIKIEELNIKPEQRNENYFNNNNTTNKKRNEIYGQSKTNRGIFNSEFDTISSDSDKEESVLLTGRTMHVGYVDSCDSNRSSESEKNFKFIDTDLKNQTYEKPSSTNKSTESSEEETQNYTTFYPQWKTINKGKDKIQLSSHSSRLGEKTRSCSFNDSNRSSIDNYNDDTNNSFDRKESSCNKGKCKPSELLISKDMPDKKSNNNDEYKMPPKRETKWQVFCELYEELNGSLKEHNSEYSSSTESVKSSVNNKYYDSRKTSSHSSLERKINVAINNLKVKETDTKKPKKIPKNTELKFNNRHSKKYTEETSSDTEEVLIRNRHLKNKRIYNTKKYLAKKFRKSGKKPTEIHTSTSSDNNNYSTPTKIINTEESTSPRRNISPEPEFFHQKCAETSHKITKLQQKCPEISHKMNDKLIHETIFENSDEEPYPHTSQFPNYFHSFMDTYNRNFELIHKKGSTNLAAKRSQESSTTCDDYSKNNHQSFNPSAQANNSNVSIDKIANSGHSTTSSSFDSIDDKSVPLPLPLPFNTEEIQGKHEDLTKISSSTICLKSSSGAVDSGLGTSLSENVFIIKKPQKKKNHDEIVVVPESVGSNSSSEWSKICKAKLTVSKLPFRSKSKSSSENEDSTSTRCKPKMRVIFKREATVIDLYNPSPYEEKPVLQMKDKNSLQKNKRFRCLRNFFSCCSQ